MKTIKYFVKRIFILLGFWKETKKIITSDVLLEMNNILGKDKISLIDVGGAVNLQPHHHKLIGNCFFYVFEPDVRSYNDLVRTVKRYSHPKDFYYINKALSGEDGKRTLYLTNVPTGSSILPINKNSSLFSEKSNYLFPMQEIEIETNKLNTVLKDIDVQQFDAIKLDVQGAELEIIKGIAVETLCNVLLVEMEVGLHEIYLNQATFENTNDYMKKKNFSLFEIRVNRGNIPNSIDNKSYHKIYLETHEQSPSVSARVYEFDVVYFRDINWVKENKPPLCVIKKLICLYCVYNFYTEALQMVEFCEVNNFMSESDAIKIKNSIKQMHKKEEEKLKKYKSFLKENNYITWGQYMWVPYPSN